MAGPSDDPRLDELKRDQPSLAILTDDASLAARSRDWWPLARLLEARGVPLPRPIAVVLPTSSAQVGAILQWATATGVTIVPRGLGSGVCGGVIPDVGSVVLELSAMDRILAIDVESRVVHAEAGIRGDRLEAALAARGLTAGHYPQSIALSTPGGWVASAGAGQASPAYGPIEDRLVGLTVVLADGAIVRQPALPRSATGPQLCRLFVGSEGTLGVITEVELELADLPRSITWLAFGMPDFEACWLVARDLVHDGFGPMVLRGWDEPDARRAFGARLGHAGGAVGLVGFRGDIVGLDARLAGAAGAYRARGGKRLADAYGEDWWAHRLDAVRVFDDVMGPRRSLGPGVVLDTFEVVSLWRGIGAAYRSIAAALNRTAASVGCHFSHVYGTGAGLYFTFLIEAADDEDAERTYHQLWVEALQACLSSGASIAHHHGVGRLKREAFERDLGAGTTHLLGLVKSALDPAGILNPGLQLGSRRPG